MSAAQDFENQFLTGVLENDFQTLEKIYAIYLPEVTVFVKSTHGSADDARETLQEAILEIFKKATAPDFEITTSFGAYLYGLCRYIWHRKLKNKYGTAITLASDEKYPDVEFVVQTDPALAEELTLYSDGSTDPEPSEEDALRANLALLDKKHAVPLSENKPLFNWWMAAAIVLAGFAIWWWNTTPDQPAYLPVIDENSYPTEILETTVPPETPDEEKTPPMAKNESTENESQVPLRIVPNFDRSPELEALFYNQVKDEAYRFRVSQPIADASINDQDGKATLQVSGVLETTGDRVEAPFRVLLFSNKKGDYENFKPILTRNLVFKKGADGFQFSSTTQMSLPQGLYYFLIEREDSGLVYHISRVQVD